MVSTQVLVNLDALAAYKEITQEETGVAAALTAISAMLAAMLVNAVWRRTRLWMLGTPIAAALIAGPLSYLLLLMGAGQVATDPATGVIVWPPVVSCAVAGLSIGVLIALAVGLIRVGGRRRV